MKKFWLYISLLILSTGCASLPDVDSLGAAPPDLPYRTWEIGLLAPNYMEVWVESVDVLDQRGVGYYRVHGGLPSIQNPPDNRGNPTGWPSRPGGGAARPMTGIDLPEIVFVRWQSLAEPETYRVRVNIPDWVREEMIKPQAAYCAWRDKHETQYRNLITIGLAPAGIAKVWLIGGCLEPLEVGRFVGSIHPEGPYDGTSDGLYYRDLNENAQRYIDAHGIPFGSW